jgi:hypothetical protein
MTTWFRPEARTRLAVTTGGAQRPHTGSRHRTHCGRRGEFAHPIPIQQFQNIVNHCQGGAMENGFCPRNLRVEEARALYHEGYTVRQTYASMADGI